MTDNNINKEYLDLINDIKKELPNIILPSMGMFDEVSRLDIDGKEFLISNDIKEEQI